MITSFLFLVAGFSLLIYGANYLVEGASSLAKRLGITELVIGLTIVAFGTSAPELIVSLVASFQGNTEIAIGNIIGSNIANILLILGVSASIYPLAVRSSTVWKEIPFAFLAVVLLGLMANDAILEGAASSYLGLTDGLILLSFFIIFMYYTFGISGTDEGDTGEGEEVKIINSGTAAFYILGGLIALVVGGTWVVDSATALALALGFSASFIGLTVVAVGTSLPELVTSVVAAMKKKSDIAIGNVVGSNIFNVFLVLGLSAVVRPLPLTPQNNFDIGVVIIASLLLFLAMFVGRRRLLERWQGVVFILLYILYIALLVVRG